MQMIERPWGVVTYGAASVKAMPDLVRIRFQVVRLAQTPADSLAAGANEIEAVEFDVRAKPELRAQARRQAVAAARRKAELYAEAAGVRVGAVLHIDDVDSDNPAHQVYRGHASYGGEASAEDLAPGHVVVSASVVLGLAINQD
jgi:uncharacterized protein YggE